MPATKIKGLTLFLGLLQTDPFSDPFSFAMINRTFVFDSRLPRHGEKLTAYPGEKQPRNYYFIEQTPLSTTL